jgi:hypothetical protein
MPEETTTRRGQQQRPKIPDALESADVAAVVLPFLRHAFDRGLPEVRHELPEFLRDTIIAQANRFLHQAESYARPANGGE